MELFLAVVLALEVVLSVYQLRVREHKIKQLNRIIHMQLLVDQGKDKAIAKLKKENRELHEGNIAIMEHWWNQS